eukprot:6849288-Lingulodinium_polyedra.AAC.1
MLREEHDSDAKKGAGKTTRPRGVIPRRPPGNEQCRAQSWCCWRVAPLHQPLPFRAGAATSSYCP